MDENKKIRLLIREAIQNSNINDNFWKWFAGSKVAKNGKPIVVYHGSRSEEPFSEFDGERGAGWFTPNENYAKNYAEPSSNVGKYYLSIKKPFTLGNVDEVMSFEEFKEKTGVDVEEKWASKISGPGQGEEYREMHEWYDPTFTNFLDVLYDSGYDGLKTIELGSESWLIFYPEQAKSINNDGSWGQNNPDIYS